jgi:DNA-binding PadR family transcriptional regulator
MAREKYKTLTEQMFYILICFQKERCGIDITNMVSEMTEGRVVIGPGTLYALIGDFVKQGIIYETAVDGRKRNYMITDKGREMLLEEYGRLKTLVTDFENGEKVN